MKKIISSLLILFILCGCSRVSLDRCIKDLDVFFKNYHYSNTSHGNNNNTKYYSFYLPSDIQEFEYDDSFHHMIFYDSDFAMNLNINYILCDKVFSQVPDDPFSILSSYAIYENDNLSTDSSDKYKFCLYVIDQKYFFSLYTNKLSFFGTTNLNQVVELVNHLFILNNSANMDYDKIIDSYYLGTTIDYSQAPLDLFNIYIRPSGLLSDIVEKDEIVDTPFFESDAIGDIDNNDEE